MSRYKNLAKNTVLFTISNFTTKVVAFILLPFYTLYLTTDEYGYTDLITTTINLAIPILMLSITDGVMRFCINEEKTKQTIYFTIAIKITAVASLFGLIISFLFFKYIDSNFMWMYAWLLFVSMALNSLLSQFARAINKISSIVISSIASSIALLSLSYLLIAYFKLGIAGYMLSITLSNSVGIFIYLLMINIWDYINLNVRNKNARKELLSYSIPLIPNSILWWLNSSVNKYILVAFVSMSDSGMYSAANKLPAFLTIFVTIFYQAWNISILFEKSIKDVENFFSDIYSKFSTFTALLASLIIIFIKPIAGLLLKGDFYQAWIYVPVLILGFYFSSLSSILSVLYNYQKKTTGLMITTMVGTVVNVLLSVVLIPRYSVWGATISLTLSFIVAWIAREISCRKIINIKGSLSKLLLTQVALAVLVVLSSIQLGGIFAQLAWLGFIMFINKNDIYEIVSKLTKSISVKFTSFF